MGYFQLLDFTNCAVRNIPVQVSVCTWEAPFLESEWEATFSQAGRKLDPLEAEGGGEVGIGWRRVGWVWQGVGAAEGQPMVSRWGLLRPCRLVHSRARVHRQGWRVGTALYENHPAS